jgi:hypothetical protein
VVFIVWIRIRVAHRCLRYALKIQSGMIHIMACKRHHIHLNHRALTSLYVDNEDFLAPDHLWGFQKSVMEQEGNIGFLFCFYLSARVC